MNHSRGDSRDLTRRRTITVLGSAVGTTLLSGCLANSETGNGDDPGNGSETSGNGNGTGTPTDDPSGDPDSNTGGETVTSQSPEGPLPETCPAYENVDQVRCYDAVTDDDVDVYLEPSARKFGESESIEFTLYNNSDRLLYVNFYNWHVHKHVGGEWYFVAPRGWNQPLMMVEAGDSHTWTVTVDNNGIEDGETVPRVSATEEVELAGLGGGHYAFRTRGNLEGDDNGSSTAYAATFEFDAEPIALTPTSAVETTTWDGETLVVESSRGNPDDEDFTRAAYTLERVEFPEETPTSLLTEQVLREDRLRDTLALASQRNASRVRLEEYTSSTPVFGARTDRVVEFQGDLFAVSTEALE